MQRFESEIFKKPDTIISLNILRNKEFVDGFFEYLRNKEKKRGKRSLDSVLRWKTGDTADFLSSNQEQDDNISSHKNSLIFFSYSNALFISRLFQHEITTYHRPTWLKEELELTLKRASMAGYIDVIETLFAHGAAAHMSFGASFKEDITRSYNVYARPLRQAKDEKYIEEDNLRKFKNWSDEKKALVMIAACEHGDVKLVQYLLKNSIIIPRYALSLCVFFSKDSGFELFEYLLTIEKWNEEQKVEALDTSCKVGALRHIQHLLKEGMSLTFDNLLSSASADDNYDLIALVHGSQIFSDRCLILAALSPKPVPVFSILCQSQTTWSNKAVTETMEVACAKLDMLLVECIVMNFKGRLGLRVLTIAARQSNEQEIGMELLRFLMNEYHWDTKQKSMALSSAADQLSIPVARLLLQEGAQYEFLNVHKL